jgi:hypothetical protein
VPLSHCSALTVGLDAGAWCAYGNPADLPGDQRRDDALSLSLDSAPLQESVELLGQPELSLAFAVDRPRAFVVARLCDVAPDGASTLITRGVLNLCHREGHEQPDALRPGERYAARVALKSVAYAVPAGHRVRLALSTSYWPWLWPSPERATLTVVTGGASSLRLPVRAPGPEDERLSTFNPPETAPALPFEWLRPRAPRQEVLRDDASGAVQMRMARDFFGAKRLPSGLEYHDDDPVRLRIVEGDPLSARVECERRIDLRRGEWRTRVEVRSVMTADAEDFHVSSVVDAYEGDTRVHTRSFTTRVPRDHC